MVVIRTDCWYESVVPDPLVNRMVPCSKTIFDIDYSLFIRDYEHCNSLDMKVFVMVYCDGISYDVGILEEVSLTF